MKTRNALFGFGFIALLASCSSTKVMTDMDKSTDFTAYKTYQLKPFERPESKEVMMVNELNEKRMLAAVEDQLVLSGMEVSENPDAFVVYGFEVDIKKGYYSSSSYNGGYYRSGFGSSYTSETNTAQGTLTVALVDAETDELLWISHGTKDLKLNSKKIDENINEAVEKVFEDFPVEHYVGKQADPEALSLK